MKKISILKNKILDIKNENENNKQNSTSISNLEDNIEILTKDKENLNKIVEFLKDFVNSPDIVELLEEYFIVNKQLISYEKKRILLEKRYEYDFNFDQYLTIIYFF